MSASVALPYIIAYAGMALFLFLVINRIVAYMNNPIHVRWELYPVPHEGGGKAAYGGSYLEESYWWQKPRDVSRMGELKVMIPEILFLKAVWEHNRPLWFLTFPFHMGLYILIGFIGLLTAGAIAKLAGVSPESGAVIFIYSLTAALGPIGFILTIIGAVGLFMRRLFDPKLRNYSSFEHYFNLLLFIATMGTAFFVWRTVDGNFDMAREFVANLVTLNLSPINNGLFMTQVILAFLTIAYIPMTHMSHFFMKYFLYHDIRWGDEPNINSPETDKKIGVVLNYPVSWSAPHIAGDGKKTWAEVATFNPMAEPEEGKE